MVPSAGRMRRLGTVVSLEESAVEDMRSYVEATHRLRDTLRSGRVVFGKIAKPPREGARLGRLHAEFRGLSSVSPGRGPPPSRRAAALHRRLGTGPGHYPEMTADPPDRQPLR